MRFAHELTAMVGPRGLKNYGRHKKSCSSHFLLVFPYRWFGRRFRKLLARAYRHCMGRLGAKGIVAFEARPRDDASCALLCCFRSLASKLFPADIRNVCVSAYTQKTPNLRCRFRKRRLTNTPRRHRLADGQISSHLPTLAKLQLVWRRLWDVVLFHSSYPFGHTLTVV